MFLNETEAGVADAARRLEPGDTVRLWIDRPGSAKPRRAGPQAVGDLEIVFEDAALLVVNKPAGLLDGAARAEERRAVGLRADRGSTCAASASAVLYVVHRIDQDTSGLVVFAKDAGGAVTSEGAVQAPRA